MATLLTEVALPAATLLLGGAGGAAGLWAWLKSRTEARASVEVAEVKQAADLLPAIGAFQKALNETAEGMLAGLRAEVAALKEEVQQLQDENVTCRTENARLVASHGFLVDWLRAQGLTVPEGALPNIITIIDDGKVSLHDVAEPLRG